MNDEIIDPTAATKEMDATADTAAETPEATPTPPKANECNDTPEAEGAPQKPSTPPSPPSMEERMLEMLLREKHPDTLATALANGKTIRGAWNYVVSVMNNAYITAHGKVSGGMCGSPEVVEGIAERYLREFPEGYTEPEASHTPKKKTEVDAAKDRAKAAAEVANTAKAAAKAAKAEAKKSKAEQVKALFGSTQLSFNW